MRKYINGLSDKEIVEKLNSFMREFDITEQELAEEANIYPIEALDMFIQTNEAEGWKYNIPKDFQENAYGFYINHKRKYLLFFGLQEYFSRVCDYIATHLRAK